MGKPKSEALVDFNTRFLHLLKQTKNLGVPLEFNEIRSVWITALPPDFSILKENNNKRKLDDNWTQSCTNAGDLIFSTMLEMKHSNITVGSKSSTPSEQKLQMTSKNLHSVKSSDRADYPSDFPSFKELKAEFLKQKNDGKQHYVVLSPLLASYPYK